MKERIFEFWITFFVMMLLACSEANPNALKAPICSVSVAAPMRPFKADCVYQLKHFNAEKLSIAMTSQGFSGHGKMNLFQLRQLYAAWQYDWLISEVSTRTGLTKGQVFAIFVFESLFQGVETDLFRLHLNPGGIKHTKGQKAMFYDDCKGKCAFSSADHIGQMIDTWTELLNTRYKQCRGNSEQVFKGMQAKGYHTSKNYKGRVALASKYERYLACFPTENAKNWFL